MSVTKQNIIDSVIYELKKLDYVNHPAIVEDVLNDVYNQLMADMSPASLKNFEFYTKNYEATIVADATSGRYYSTLPVSIVNLQKPQMGVIAINSKDGTGFRFYPTTELELRLTENLESGLYDRYYGWYLNRDKIWYSHKMTSVLATAGVRLSLAVQFKDFAATDVVPLPKGRNYDMKQLAIDYLRQTQIFDLQLEDKD
jgi:hypothetical protein